MSSLRLALKLSLSDAQPDEKDSKKSKILLDDTLSGKYVKPSWRLFLQLNRPAILTNSLAWRSGLNVALGRKRKATSDNQEQRSKIGPKDSATSSSAEDDQAPGEYR